MEIRRGESGDVAADELVDEVWRQLDRIHDPCSIARSLPMGLGEMGLVKAIEFSDGGRVIVTLRLTSPFCEMINYLRTEVIRRLASLDGVESVAVRHDSGLDWDPGLLSPEAARRRRRYLSALREAFQEPRAQR